MCKPQRVASLDVATMYRITILDSYGSSAAQSGKKSQANLDGSGSSGLGKKSVA
jgi:hypothetical protein